MTDRCENCSDANGNMQWSEPPGMKIDVKRARISVASEIKNIKANVESIKDQVSSMSDKFDKRFDILISQVNKLDSAIGTLVRNGEAGRISLSI